MIVDREDELVRLRRENRELREELEEYRRPRPGAPGDVDQRLVALRQKLRVQPQTGRLLLALADASPAALSLSQLAERIGVSRDCDHPDNVVRQQIHRARQSLLKRAPGRCSIDAEFGIGVRMAPESARALKSLASEAAA